MAELITFNTKALIRADLKGYHIKRGTLSSQWSEHTWLLKKRAEKGGPVFQIMNKKKP
jgi:hypothetical protein